MSIPIVQVDSFTSEPFRGNPAGVCLLDAEAEVPWMQAVAAEMNLAETAFVVPRGDREYSLRWFTPTTEVPLCGHATLASAHTLWERGLVPADQPITFHAQKGVLRAQREADWICLNFPVMPVVERTAPDGLADALGARPISVFTNEFPSFLVELESERTVRELRPNIALLAAGEYSRCIVTARSDAGTCDFVSRFFAPGVGIDEDPVTGSAHCSLAPFWAERLAKSEMVGQQVSPRGGVVKVRLLGDRVDLLGQAVTVIRGELVGRHTTSG